MAKDNEAFFQEKKTWSKVKDDLLGHYLKPYVAKILHTGHPLLYVDCFAGKGKFEDGEGGSPLIALKTISGCLEETRSTNRSIETCFIDKNYAQDLIANTKGYPNVQIIDGTYEDRIASVLQGRQGSNVFLYIDPYGIKALDCSLFDNLMRQKFYSIELLINMNSFGFVREACRVKNVAYPEMEFLDDIIEYAPTILSPSDQSFDNLNKIAGGAYWEQIIEDYQSGRIDTYQAEQRFSKEYCERLSQSYKYVLNMPIRLKRGQRPKYRMIHATNHADGCVLMYENMSRRWELLEDIQSLGQRSLFDQTVENEFVDQQQISENLIRCIGQFKNEIPLNDFKASFFMEYGVICKLDTLKKILMSLESNRRIIFRRQPPTTSSGKPSQSFTVSPKQKIWVRSNR
jgi:three-Cys-motif partner protein